MHLNCHLERLYLLLEKGFQSPWPIQTIQVVIRSIEMKENDISVPLSYRTGQRFLYENETKVGMFGKRKLSVFSL